MLKTQVVQTNLQKPPRHLFIVEENDLVAQYLAHLLTNNSTLHLQPSRYCSESMTLAGRAKKDPLFVVDHGGIPHPLFKCVQTLKHRYPGGEFIVLNRESSPTEIAHLHTLGVRGFVSYAAVPTDLIPAIHSVSQGKSWMPQRPPQLPLEHSASVKHCEDLTLREIQILELVRRRLTNKEIAVVFNIEESTVKFHISNMLRKKGVGKRANLWRVDRVDRADISIAS